MRRHANDERRVLEVFSGKKVSAKHAAADRELVVTKAGLDVERRMRCPTDGELGAIAFVMSKLDRQKIAQIDPILRIMVPVEVEDHGAAAKLRHESEGVLPPGLDGDEADIEISRVVRVTRA